MSAIRQQLNDDSGLFCVLIEIKATPDYQGWLLESSDAGAFVRLLVHAPDVEYAKDAVKEYVWYDGSDLSGFEEVEPVKLSEIEEDILDYEWDYEGPRGKLLLVDIHWYLFDDDETDYSIQDGIAFA